MTTPLPDDHQQLARWLRGEDEVPNDAELLRHLSGKTWDVPVPTLLGHRWGWPPKGTWLHASVVQVMTMLHDEDLQGMAPAVHMVHALLDAGASPNIQDAAGRTPLHELFERLPARLNAGSNWLAGIVQALLLPGSGARSPLRRAER